jgi:hypothetical protein
VKLKQLIALLALVALSGSSLSGCAPSFDPNEKEEDATVEQGPALAAAKAATVVARDDVLELFPEGSVSEIQVLEEATLIQCSSEEYSWPGGATVITTGEWDSDSFLRAVEAAFARREGWEVSNQIEAKQMVVGRSDSGLEVYTSVVKGGE